MATYSPISFLLPGHTESLHFLALPEIGKDLSFGQWNMGNIIYFDISLKNISSKDLVFHFLLLWSMMNHVLKWKVSSDPRVSAQELSKLHLTLRINAFELWCWRRPWRVPWIAGRSNQAILKEIHPEYSLEGLILKPKLQYFGHLMWRTDSLEKTLMLGKMKGRGRRGWQIMKWLHGIIDSMDIDSMDMTQWT